MSFNWSNIPTEVEMPPNRFGPKQIKLFLEKMAKDILPNSDLAKGVVSVDEGGLIRACGRYIIFRRSEGVWDLSLHNKFEREFYDPFGLISFVLKLELEREVSRWQIINYHCVA